MWPLASRGQISLAYRQDADPQRDSTFRALRRIFAASNGRQVTSHDGGHIVRSSRLFCSLNIDAAHLARMGNVPEAAALAEQAARIESSDLFVELCEHVGQLSLEEIAQVQAGRWRPAFAQGLGNWTAITNAAHADLGQPGARVVDLLSKVAVCTAEIRAEQRPNHLWNSVIAGFITEVGPDTARVEEPRGSYDVPVSYLSHLGQTRPGNEIVVMSESRHGHIAISIHPGISWTVQEKKRSSIGFSPFMSRGGFEAPSVDAFEALRSSTPRILFPTKVT